MKPISQWPPFARYLLWTGISLSLIGLWLFGVLFLFVAAMMGGLSNLFYPWYGWQMAGHLLFGWVFFVSDRLPRVTWNAEIAVTGVLCLVGLMVGLNSFGRWLWNSRQSSGENAPSTSATAPVAWRWRWTASIVALVVVSFSAGTAMIGIVHQISWLLMAKTPIYYDANDPSMREHRENYWRSIENSRRQHADDEQAEK